MTSHALRGVLAILVLSLVACGDSTPRGGGDDGGAIDLGRDMPPRTDSGPRPDLGRRDQGPPDAGPDLGAEGDDCSPTAACGAGLQCCVMAECDGTVTTDEGICRGLEVECPIIPDCPPPDPCTAMEARGEGACELLLGIAWDGEACVFLSGCECVGADCGDVYGSIDECETATESCTAEVVCGGRAGPTCTDAEFCDFPDAAMCGFADGTGICAPRPVGCPDVVEPVCACDGRTYGNECEAHAAGTDVLRREACDDDPDCAPMDARGEGLCDAFFGYAWNGRMCVGISGCSCVGTDCRALFETPRECEMAYGGCTDTTDPDDPDDPDGPRDAGTPEPGRPDM